MNWLTSLLNALFRQKPKPRPEPKPETFDTRRLNFTVDPPHLTLSVRPDDGPEFGGVRLDGDPENRRVVSLSTRYAGGATWTASADGYVHASGRLSIDGRTIDYLGGLVVLGLSVECDPIRLAPSVTRRSGVVVAEGKSFRDADGFFHPLGATFFWALFGWMNGDRERVRQHYKFWADRGFDFVRTLGEVDWSGQVIDPNHPDYVDAYADMIRMGYEEFGVRTQITAQGGRYSDPMGLADRVARVVERVPAASVFAVEAVNEPFIHGKIDEESLTRMTWRLRRGLPQHLVTFGAVDDLDSAYRMITDTGANWVTRHSERQFSDHAWRAVRQGWDFKAFTVPASHNEPPGPGSSVAVLYNPLRLTMMRAVGILCGASAFVLHTGSGIYGTRRTITAQNDTDGRTETFVRPANAWEEPNIDVIAQSVRDVSQLLPSGVSGWQRSNDNWAIPAHPLKSQAFWGDGSESPVGVNKNYAAISQDGRFVTMPCGVRSRNGEQPFVTAERACEVRIFDPMNPSASPRVETLAAGQRLQLDGRDDTEAAYIIHGTFL